MRRLGQATRNMEQSRNIGVSYEPEMTGKNLNGKVMWPAGKVLRKTNMKRLACLVRCVVEHDERRRRYWHDQELMKQ
jgi:hypothetical protein